MTLTTDDLIPLLEPRFLKSWLSNPTARKNYLEALQQISINSRWSDNETKVYKDVPKNPDNPEIDPDKLANLIKRYIFITLKEWKNKSSDLTAKQLVASIPLFVEMSKYLPHVNPSDNYSSAFRGTSFSMSKLKQFVRKTKPTDWKPTTAAGISMMAYTGPAKNKFSYKPHRLVQSWSVSKDAAVEFGDVIIATPIDKSFFFDPEFTKTFGYTHEEETIHFGKQPMKVALLIDKNDWMDFRAGTFRANADLSETDSGSIEVSDDEGTLTIPQI